MHTEQLFSFSENVVYACFVFRILLGEFKMVVSGAGIFKA
jgi:hypothetical protein